MYHSLQIGEKNTYTDWHLIPVSRLIFNPPEVKEQFVDIPGADGSIDLTDALMGRPAYQNREGSMEFIVLNDYNSPLENWATRYSQILQYLHGRRYPARLEDDPNFYYYGRFFVSEWSSDDTWSHITIDYNVEPFKYNIVPEAYNINVTGHSISEAVEVPFSSSQYGIAAIKPNFKCTTNWGEAEPVQEESGVVIRYVNNYTGVDTQVQLLDEPNVYESPYIVFAGDGCSMSFWLRSPDAASSNVSIRFNPGRL